MAHTKRTKRLKELDSKCVWHPFAQMQEWQADDPPIIERAKGAYLVDTDNRRYLDGVSSLWVNVHGHANSEIDRAIKDQLKRIAHSTLLGLGNVPSIELARELISVAPKGLSKVFYSDNGSTAVEAALKMSYQYRQNIDPRSKKRAFVAFTGAYHGDTIGAMSVGEIDVFVKRFGPLLFDVERAPYPYCYRCPLKKDPKDCSLACLDEFEKVLKKRHERLTACIIEPGFEGASGMIAMPKGFLRGLRDLTLKYDVHLIADEVAAGFGRTGKLFACDHEGVTPDFLCLAKGLTGGYMPLAATLTTDEVYSAFLGQYDEFKSFFHGHTYTGNQLGCSAALANLKLFKKGRVIQRLKRKIRLLSKLLDEFKSIESVGDIRQIGFVAGVELVADKSTKKSFPIERRIGHRITLLAREYGVITRNLSDTLVIMPPYCIEDKDLERLISVLVRSTKKVLG